MSETYKVLRIVPSLNPNNGGVVTAINEFISCVDFSKTSVDILCFDKKDDLWISNYIDVHVHCLEGYITSFCYNKNYIRWLKKHAKKYDLVIIDGLWQYHLYGGIILKKLNVSYCVYVHGMLDPYFNQFKIKYLKKLPFWFHHTRKVLSKANKVLFTCEEEFNLSKKSFPLSKFEHHILKIGVSVPGAVHHSDDLSLSLDDKHNYALFLSRIHPKKGLEILFDAISQISDLVRERKYIIQVAGTGDKVYIKKLKSLTQSLNIADIVEFVGPLYGHEKWKTYRNSQVFILPTHQENFGLVLAEALGCGIPVITTNKSNIWKDIHDCGAGFICDDSVESLKDTLVKWFNLNPVEVNKYKSLAKMCYVKNYSLDSMKNSFDELIMELQNNAKT